MIQEIKEYDSDTCLEIGIRIQDIRESRHMKAIELASYLGIGKNQMSRIESGKANCTIPQLYCIAQILDCSADFLLFGGSYHDIFRAVPHRHRAFDGRLRRVDLQGPFHAEDRQKVYALHRPLFRRLPGADAADGLPSRQPVFRVYRALRPLDRLRPARADRL